VTRHIETTAGDLRHGDVLRVARSTNYVLVHSATTTGDDHVDVTVYDGTTPAEKPTLRFKDTDLVQLAMRNMRAGATIASRVSMQRIEATIGTLVDLTTENHPELDGTTRDDISRVIHVLNQISDRRSREQMERATRP
jgi:hypothetical protein